MGNIFTKRATEGGPPSQEPTTMNETPRVDSSKIDTIIGPNSTIKGDIHSKGTLRIDGNIEGKVTSDSTIILGEKGVAKATLTAQQVIIGGTVHGNIVATDRLEILSSGRVHGDVQTATARLIIAEGVQFEGRVSMGAAKKSEENGRSGGQAQAQGGSNVKQPRQQGAKSEAEPAGASGG